MDHFYRYLRPLEFNFARHEVNTSPRGGVCFRVLDTGMTGYGGLKHLKISYSICREIDVFDRVVAKRIADSRWNGDHRIEVYSPSVAVNMIGKAVVEAHSISQFQQLLDETPTDLYRSQDLRLLVERIEEIWRGHRRSWELAELTRSTIKAIGIEKAYERIQGR